MVTLRTRAGGARVGREGFVAEAGAVSWGRGDLETNDDDDISCDGGRSAQVGSTVHHQHVLFGGELRDSVFSRDTVSNCCNMSGTVSGAQALLQPYRK